jgi:hypothetical protein
MPQGYDNSRKATVLVRLDAETHQILRELQKLADYRITFDDIVSGMIDELGQTKLKKMMKKLDDLERLAQLGKLRQKWNDAPEYQPRQRKKKRKDAQK